MADSNFAIRMILILLAVVILVVLVTQYNKTKKNAVSEEAKSRGLFGTHENYAEPVKGGEPTVAPQVPSSDAAPKPTPAAAINEVRPSESLGNEDYKAVDFATESKVPSECFPRDRNTLEDLLPKDAANTTWAQVNPAGQGDVKDQNFLNAGAHIGMNTVGQTLRNANYSLRSEPPNPKLQVSPWNQSTIEFDSARRHFEVGEC